MEQGFSQELANVDTTISNSPTSFGLDQNFGVLAQVSSQTLGAPKPVRPPHTRVLADTSVEAGGSPKHLRPLHLTHGSMVI